MVLLYAFLAYGTDRDAFAQLAGIWVALAGLSYYLIHRSGVSIVFLFLVSLACRLVMMPAWPWLSQDFYRFIWDGRLLVAGWNPYLFTPDELIRTAAFSSPSWRELYEGMGSLSAGNYSNYPPVHQFLFWTGAWAGKASIPMTLVVFRLITLGADIGIFWMSRKIFQRLQWNENRIFWYLLNPLVIIETIGNLHFEGVMLFFVVLSIYWLSEKRWLVAALPFGCAVATKLIPLIWIPAFLSWLGWKKTMAFSAGMIGVVILLFVPFASTDWLSHYSGSVALWFVRFEFNASLYYVVREAGYLIKGYNIIGIAGWLLPSAGALAILMLSLRRQSTRLVQVWSVMAFSMGIYFFSATTVHPWYLTSLVLLSLFSGLRFPLVWSVTAVLSYHAYAQPVVQENLWLIALEYIPVFYFFYKDLNHASRNELS